jgi:hypothetical protein
VLRVRFWPTVDVPILCWLSTQSNNISGFRFYFYQTHTYSDFKGCCSHARDCPQGRDLTKNKVNGLVVAQTPSATTTPAAKLVLSIRPRGLRAKRWLSSTWTTWQCSAPPGTPLLPVLTGCSFGAAALKVSHASTLAPFVVAASLHPTTRSGSCSATHKKRWRIRQP